MIESQINCQNDTAKLADSVCYNQPFFRQKEIEIWNEDCLKTMLRMEANSVDLVVTSPPYDDLRDYKGFCFDFYNVRNQLFRVLKPGGIIVWVVGDATKDGSETGTSFKQALSFMEAGFKLHDTMLFKANKPPLTHNRYEQCFEFMFVFSKEKPKTFNPILVKSEYSGSTKNCNYSTGSTMEKKAAMRSGMERSYVIKGSHIKENIWFYPIGSNCSSKDAISFNHPATFPEQLAADHIYSWSNEGDLVYDPFGGSGTTAKMAHLQRRRCIMSEISTEYCQIAKKRIEPYLMQERLF